LAPNVPGWPAWHNRCSWLPSTSGLLYLPVHLSPRCSECWWPEAQGCRHLLDIATAERPHPKCLGVYGLDLAVVHSQYLISEVSRSPYLASDGRPEMPFVSWSSLRSQTEAGFELSPDVHSASSRPTLPLPPWQELPMGPSQSTLGSPSWNHFERACPSVSMCEQYQAKWLRGCVIQGNPPC
jgi:hypothetical protein